MAITRDGRKEKGKMDVSIVQECKNLSASPLMGYVYSTKDLGFLREIKRVYWTKGLGPVRENQMSLLRTAVTYGVGQYSKILIKWRADKNSPSRDMWNPSAPRCAIFILVRLRGVLNAIAQHQMLKYWYLERPTSIKGANRYLSLLVR